MKINQPDFGVLQKVLRCKKQNFSPALRVIFPVGRRVEAGFLPEELPVSGAIFVLLVPMSEVSVAGGLLVVRVLLSNRYQQRYYQFTTKSLSK